MQIEWRAFRQKAVPGQVEAITGDRRVIVRPVTLGAVMVTRYQRVHRQSPRGRGHWRPMSPLRFDSAERGKQYAEKWLAAAYDE